MYKLVLKTLELMSKQRNKLLTFRYSSQPTILLAGNLNL